MPLMQVVMVNIFPAEARGTAMGLNGIVIGLAPAIGPTLSGWLLQKHGTVMGLNLNGLATAQQATTWFMLANGIMMPVSAFLSTRIPTKVLYITAYLLLFIGMTITSLTPAQHDMWWMFLAGRIAP
ncbi:hypothetical protein H7R52_02280 [Weissella confusa]|uniref:Major facilitator superfamily (MFS) profile domain-containing protein n=1 Tax=Weissella confusa TaxID=1583 RepID=A0A923SSQ7_WEICO|nr:hypothetical protein [Weissella confusa]